MSSLTQHRLQHHKNMVEHWDQPVVPLFLKASDKAKIWFREKQKKREEKKLTRSILFCYWSDELFMSRSAGWAGLDCYWLTSKGGWWPRPHRPLRGVFGKVNLSRERERWFLPLPENERVVSAVTSVSGHVKRIHRAGNKWMKHINLEINDENDETCDRSKCWKFTWPQTGSNNGF